MQHIYQNIDALEFSVLDTPSEEFLDFLKSHKQIAQEQNQPSVFILDDKGTTATVGQKGVGVYTYLVEVGGEFGYQFFIKNSAKIDKNGNALYNVRIHYRAGALATKGLIECKKEVYELAKEMHFNIDWSNTVVGRLDFAMDFIDNDFRLNPDLLITRSKVKGQQDSETEIDDDGNKWQKSGNNYTSVTSGSMPRKEVQIYNKTREIKAKKKNWWFDIWGINKEDNDTVWRFELRCGKDYLQDQHNIKSIDDMEKSFLAIFMDIVQTVRYTTGGGDNNRSRWDSSEQWESLTKNIAKFVENTFAVKQVDTDKVKNRVQNDLKSMITAQVYGCLNAIHVLEGSEQEYKEFAIDKMKSYNNYLESDKGKKLMELTNLRYGAKYNWIDA